MVVERVDRAVEKAERVVENVKPLVENVERLDAGQLSAVLALVEAATREDGVAPLSEQVLLAAQDTSPAGTPTDAGTSSAAGTSPAADTSSASGTSSPHFLAYDGTHLAGYAHLEREPDGATAEVVVDPGHRRQGVGTTLIRALQQSEAQTLRLWSHGHLEAARALAAREGFSSVRELWSMHRSLRPDAGRLPAVHLPAGFAARHFVVGQDEDAWLRVNARAFVDHPEQGRMTRLDLDRRIAQPWFDATGFILIEDLRGTSPVLAASHWTKVVPGEVSGAVSGAVSGETSGEISGEVSGSDAQVSPTQGEVYVVGVDPAYQGLGLGRAVTVLGLEHLIERGLVEAILYVDADNTAAVRTYSRMGFTRASVDVMFSPGVHLPVSR